MVAGPLGAADQQAEAPDVHLAGVRKTYGDVVAVDSVDLAIARGEFFTLLGPSGSGKTTTLRLIAGFERPDAGRIELRGVDVASKPPYEPYVALARKLCEIVPIPGATKAALFNSGAEAVENAVKIARRATGRPAVLAFDPGFHGRTLLALTLTSKTTPYRDGFGPFAPEVYRFPIPDPLRRPRARAPRHRQLPRAQAGLRQPEREPDRMVLVVRNLSVTEH